MKRIEVERMSVGDFLRGQYGRRNPERRTLGLITASPGALLDPVALIAAGVVLIAVNAESFLVRMGLYDIADGVGAVLRVALPVAAFGGFLYLMYSSPFISWR